MYRVFFEEKLELTYDPRHNIAYIRFKEPLTGVNTIKLSEYVNLDIAPDGTLYGIELLNASQQLGELQKKKVRLVNEASRKQVEYELP